MKLIIAEKPMLARAIADAIPGTAENRRDYIRKGGYTIVSAFGHLLTLKEPEDYDAEKYRTWSMEALPIYFPDWGKKPGEGKAERLNLIGSLLQEADEVIHAGDPDDEGQYLIDEILDWFRYTGPVYRLATGDTTEAALAKALANLQDNRAFVNAGRSAHARSVADIMVGFNFSRYFTLLNPHVKMLTVGRVQTPTLGLVVTRDLAIENHTGLFYYLIKAGLSLAGHSVPARFDPLPNDPNLEDGKITGKDYAASLADGLRGLSLNGVKITRKELTEQPHLPFNLVKLQTYCSNKFGYDPSETLAITQTLRDNHNAITYNRSDCQYLSEEQYKQSPATVRRVLDNLRGDAAEKVFSRLPLDTSLHSKAFDDANITAHTAIIPQNRALDLNKLTEKERNVYLAITKYYLAQFLPPAKKLRTTLECPLENGTLKANSTTVTFPGYLQLIRPEKGKDADEDSENELSQIEPGTYSAVCDSATVEEKETKAPPRYTKASLNEDMTRIARYVTDPEAKALLLQKDKDKKGENGSIGTSATRASIIDMLEERGYIVSKGKQIQSTQLGRELYRILPVSLKTPDMTGYWWAIQESVKEGTRPWTDLTDSVLALINEILHTPCPKVDSYHVPEEMRRGRLLLGSCPRCGKDILEGKTGFGCAGWKEGCKFTIWKTAKSGMLSRTEIAADLVHDWLSSGWTEETRPGEDGTPVPTGKQRSVAAIPMKKLWSENKKKSYSGLVYLTDDGPDSPYGASFALQEILHEAPVPLGSCPRCGAAVVEGKTGYGCSAWRDGCKFVIWKKAKSGMLSKTTVTKSMVKALLKSPWVEEPLPPNAPPEALPRRRTEATVHLTKLWSEQKNKTYTGDVFLSDDGPASPYGASFGLAAVTDDGPELLGTCPRCGKPVIEGTRGYGCSGFADGCRFTIWKKSKQKLLVNISFTKTDAKKFLSGKPVKKKRLVDKKNREFTALLLMEESPDNPFGPVFRVQTGSVELPEGAAYTAEDIQTEFLPAPGAEPPLPASAPEA